MQCKVNSVFFTKLDKLNYYTLVKQNKWNAEIFLIILFF